MNKPKLREWDVSSEENRGFHEAADIFPAMTDDEFEAFKKDIAENGLQTPIVTLADGKIIDGRHRWRACMETHTEPRYQIHNGNPWTYVISANLHRRHLNQSQKSMVAARVAVRKPGLRSYDPGAAHPKGGAEDHLPPTQGELAQTLGIGHSSITRARQVLRSGIPELASVVDDGTVRVETAARLAAMDVDTQKEFVKRVQDGERPRDIAPLGEGHKGGTGKKVLRPTSVALFTKINAERLSSHLFGIDAAFQDVTKVDKAVTAEMARNLIKQITTAKSVLTRLSKLLQYAAEEE
jgi:hypothetical protein